MVFTAAVLAVGAAATAIGTGVGVAAAVATAVVTVSAAVGVVGLAVTAVGAITKNEDLLEVGKIMGYVGLAGGVAGGLIGGVGGMMAGGQGFLAGAKGAYVGAGEKLAEAGGKYASFFDEAAGAKALAPVQNVNKGIPLVSGVEPSQAEIAGVLVQPGGVVGPPSTAMSGAPSMMATRPMVPTPLAPGASTLGQIPTAHKPYGMLLSDAGNGPPAPTTFFTPTPATAPGLPGTPTGPEAAANNDWMKYGGMTAGGQMLAGMASGMFQGESAAQQVELDRLKNEQTQAQIALINRNSAYAPRLTFNQSRGLINR